MGANASTAVPLYASGQVLDAARLNLTNAGVPVFSGTATRDAAFGGSGEKVLAEGQLCYLEDANVVQYYDGVSFATVGPATVTAPGLVLISSTTFTTATSVSLPTGSFSATYQNYKVQILVTATTSQSTLTARFRTAGSDNTTARYNQAAGGRTSDGAAANQNNSDTTALDILTNFSIGGYSINLDIFDPFATKNTFANGFYTIDGNAAGANVVSLPTGILFRNTTSFDSFTVISSVASSLTGVARVYGYTNS